MKRAILFLTLSIILLSAEIESIRYEGRDLSCFMLLKEGDQLDPAKLHLFVKRAYATGEFENVQVEVKEGKRGVVLVVKSWPKSRVRKIEFEGSSLKSTQLRKALTAVREGDFFERNRVEEAVKEIKDYLEYQGYFHPEVVWSFRDGILKFTIRRAVRNSITAIVVEGRKLDRFYSLSAGEHFTMAALQQSMERFIKELKEKGYLRARVSWRLSEEKGGVKIFFDVERGKKYVIYINGFDVPKKVVLPYWEKPYVREWALFESKTAIRNYLGSKGYFAEKIEADVEEGEKVVEVYYFLRGLRKIKDMKIKFEGNSFLSKERLRSLLLKKRVLFTKLDLEFFKEGIERIREIYLKEGFKDFQINYEWKSDTIRVILKEGKRYFISRVDFRGNRSFSSEKLLSVISYRPASPYYAEGVQLDRLRIKYFYLSKGFRQTDVKVKTAIEGQKVTVTFIINEGIRPLLRALYISGVEPKVRRNIERLVPFRLGEPVCRDLEEDLRYRIEEMGLFSSVEIKEHIWARDSMDLIISLTEESSFSTSFGAGWEERTGPRLIFDLILRNKLLRGTTLDAGVQFGGSEKRAVVSFDAPYLFGRGISGNLSLTAEESDMESYRYLLYSFYASVSRKDRTGGWIQARFRWSRIKLLELRVSETEVDRQYLPVYLTSFSFIYALDRRDDPFNPTRGWFISSSVERAFPFLGTRTDYLKIMFHYQRYFPLKGGVLALAARAGLARGNVPIRERFFAGGSMSFRGVGIDRLSPLDPKTGNPVGGNGLMLLNIEYRLPLLEEWEAAVFYDGGEVTREIRNLSLNRWRNAAGFGIRYRTPFGPIRLDFGFNLNRQEGERLVNVYLTIGNVF